MTVVKKLIAICLVAAFLVANIGCGGGETKKSTDVKTGTGSASTEVKGDTKKTGS
jgi:hypothetical protein